jgi:LmbE family N-acetylglucosaminyl deacetylase
VRWALLPFGTFIYIKPGYSKQMPAAKRKEGKISYRLKKMAATPVFVKLYAGASVIILLLSSCLWAILGTRVQQSNADQLANPYLFESSATLQGAVFPGQHSFLLKWPLFLLMKTFGLSAATFTFFTVGTVLLTVMSLAFILYRIERRPLMFGTLCLALASVLLMIPAQPYPGGILPVNMAMVTTRNIEYIVFIAGIALIARTTHIRERRFLAGTVLLGILVASDKLFLTLGVGGALIAIVVYALVRKWSLVSVMVTWLMAMLAAALLASIILWLASKSGVTHIGGSSMLSPYGLVHNPKDVVLGSIYALFGLMTNFGANPVADYRVRGTIPLELLHGLLSWGGIAVVVNFSLLCAALYVAGSFLVRSLRSGDRRPAPNNTSFKLSLMLIWTSLTALGIFIFSNHYYPVDSRYLGIALFAGFIAGASFLKVKQLRPESVLAVGACLILAIVFGLTGSVRSYNNEKTALADTNQRNVTVAEVLKHHPVSTLAGDYWRVLPVRSASSNALKVMPLEGCLEPRQVLSSTAWQPDLQHTSFAYLLTLDGNLTNSAHCSLSQIVDSYGRPNASALIAGTLNNPKEVLLFYDKGIHKSAPATPQATEGPATVLPISLDQLPYTACAVPTVMNVVAHEDDDLLFMNPDLLNDIKAGHCVRTIYMTAGDAGAGEFYWLSREQASEAAYAKMLGTDDVWVQRIVQLGDKRFITVANPKGNSKISLIFMHLPDGNMRGEGFDATGHENLERLDSGSLGQLHSVDRQSTYDKSQLTDVLVSLMHIYVPSEIRTQSEIRGSHFQDHSDHMSASRFTKIAHEQYEAQQYEGRVTIPLLFYEGYPIRELPENVSGVDLETKEMIFSAYALHDDSVCHSRKACDRDPAYNGYLTRQYRADQ